MLFPKLIFYCCWTLSVEPTINTTCLYRFITWTLISYVCMCGSCRSRINRTPNYAPTLSFETHEAPYRGTRIVKVGTVSSLDFLRKPTFLSQPTVSVSRASSPQKQGGIYCFWYDWDVLRGSGQQRPLRRILSPATSVISRRRGVE